MNYKKNSNPKLGQGKLGQGKLGQGKLGQGKLGFSILELSIALIIISILIMAVAKGNHILKRSRIVSAQSLTKSSPVLRMSNLVVWYETTMDSSFSEADIASTNINNWYNLNPSIKTNNATAGVAPIYTKNSINNLPSLLFNGSTSYLTFDGTSIINRDYTAIVVEQRLGSGSDRYFISSNPANSNQSLTLGYRTNTQITFAQGDNGYNIAIPGYQSPSPRIHIFRFSSSLGKNYYLNGSGPQNLVSCCGSTPVPTQGLTDYPNAQIARYATTNYYFGNIGEIIIFNKYINDDEMNDIKLYLSKKWGITIT